MTSAKREFELSPESRTPRQAELVARIEAGPRGRVPINLRAWLHNPDFADVADTFGLYVSSLAPITAREKEVTVLVNAQFWGAAFEWSMHVKHARKAGLTDSQIDAIHEGVDPGFLDEKEQLTYELAYALHNARKVPDDLYTRAMSVLGHKGVSDRIGLIGLYTMIAMTLNFYDVPAPQN